MAPGCGCQVSHAPVCVLCTSVCVSLSVVLRETHMSFISKTEAPVFELLIKGVTTISCVISANAQAADTSLFKVMHVPECESVCESMCLCNENGVFS